MKAVEFAYWLQGYFELTYANLPFCADKQEPEMSPQALTEEQITVIQNHLNLVKAADKDSDFTSWLRGIIAAVELGFKIDAKATRKIQERLHVCFQHDIDPTYKGDQKSFNDIHAGQRPQMRPNDRPMRC